MREVWEKFEKYVKQILEMYKKYFGDFKSNMR